MFMDDDAAGATLHPDENAGADAGTTDKEHTEGEEHHDEAAA